MRAERSLSKSDLCPESIAGGGGEAAELRPGADLDSRNSAKIPTNLSLFELLPDLQVSMIRRRTKTTWRQGQIAGDADQ